MRYVIPDIHGGEMTKKIDYNKLFNSFNTYAHIVDCVNPQYDGDKPKKHKLYFGANYEDVPTIVIKWSEKGRGFGEYVFQYKDGQMYCHNECDSPETVKRILCTMVDQCIFDDDKW